MDEERHNEASNANEEAAQYLIGAQGSQKIRQLLSKSNNPKAAITEFQNTYGMKSTQKEQPIFELTDLLDFRRNQLHSGLMVFMRDHFLKHLEKSTEMSNIEELKLLEQVFPYIAFEELRPIANAILNKMDVIPERFLKQLKPNLIFKVCYNFNFN
jgi:hypothetical protein